LVQEDVSVDVADCGGYEAEEEEESDDDYAAQYDWYVFELTANQYEDIGAVCTVYATEGQASDDDDDNGGGYTSHTVYNGDNAGLFNYDKASSSGSGMSGGAIFAVILLLVACAGGAAAFFMKKSGGSADKKKPLINEGTMA